MVARAAIAMALLMGLVVTGATARESCLTCHPGHHAGRGSCTGCHRGNGLSWRKNVAHDRLVPGRYAFFTLGNAAPVREGARLVEASGCRRCHVSGGRGNRLANSLDGLMDRRQPGEIVAAIEKPAEGMPDFRFDRGQIDALVNAILAGSRTGVRQGGRPLVVHFEDREARRSDPFSSKCGRCHRVLSARHGVLGIGSVGPNLSGLLSSHYPGKIGGNAWGLARLERWLANPRGLRPLATMPPVALSQEEREALERILTVEQKGSR